MSDDAPHSRPRGQLRFRDRDPGPIAVGGILACAAVMALSLNFDRIPFVNGREPVTAYVADAAGLKVGDDVHVAGMKVGSVRDISLDGDRVKVRFEADSEVELGADTSAQIKTDSLLGRRALTVVSDGRGHLPGRVIPLERTSTPYSLTSALGDLSGMVSELDTNRVDTALTTLSESLRKAGPETAPALDGITRLSNSLNKRDESLRQLLSKANDASTVLGRRSQQFNQLVVDGNILFTELDGRKRAISELTTNIDQLSQQLSGLVQDNEAQLGPALEKLDKVSELLVKDKDKVDLALRRLAPFATALGEAVASGPWFNAYISNLAQPQYVQGAVHNLLPLLNRDVPNQGPLVTEPGLPAAPAFPLQITDRFPGWGKESNR